MLNLRCFLQIHDELIFLVPDDELEVMQALVKEAMEQAMEIESSFKGKHQLWSIMV